MTAHRRAVTDPLKVEITEYSDFFEYTRHPNGKVTLKVCGKEMTVEEFNAMQDEDEEAGPQSP